MLLLRNIAFYIAFYTGSLLLSFGAAGASYVRPQWVRPLCDWWSAWHHWCCVNLLGLRIVETGARPDRPVLYAIKHESFFEAIAMAHTFDYPAGVAKQELFDIPGWGRAGKAYGLIPVARDQGARALRAMLKQARAATEAGRPIVIFPEGTRVPHGTRPPLQSGFAALYKLFGLPVVPVAIDSGPIYHRRLKPRGTITWKFGEVIEPGLPRAEIEARVRDAINALNASDEPSQTPERA
ncbi:1-acyl-sn-glycerol-3-phosphate acyltransferase [Erythrobacter arachoides]|uniref:1-acyl-sn-glycerol-3-phosphate acyltransferase n=1 Tax=Aurantiacibacter arachoides TaxID=1850444 RepID=A0A845A676_9SPHN|nr:lysophospholipid acyltransferase family protein [Aurantiacibacter arachoides]MXO94427.1 1-acyl-sn-glycerol-3-phosphate acyltransferase [Aurantiacibacter arachoides]GGD63507.1 1-acyl-sn-glycerol-3-phosphate acyltransferase [Aurantiacibacter arachoides]